MPPQRDIPEDRKTAFYAGSLISGIGLLLFLSNFLIFAIHFGDFNVGPDFGKGLVFRGFGGMLLIVIGQVIRSIGARGLAGSGVILDPQKERKDLEPWSRMAGGMVNDALSEVDALGKPAEPAPVKIRCQKCRALNDEAAKFCNQCGGPL
jgi:hypothetical protein